MAFSIAGALPPTVDIGALDPKVNCQEPAMLPVGGALADGGAGHQNGPVTNLLADATSPYLLQHAQNPVDWRPWGPEAFEVAHERNAPILLSVGYAACHWCHVMAHESFENAEIAAVMNEHFVPVKVDREERPDVDAVYMDAVTAMTGHGGWPMTVFLTPDGEPFYAGTYFPPRRRGDMPGFPDVLKAVSATWRDRAGDVRQQATAVLARIDQLRAAPAGAGQEPPTPDDCASAVGALAKQYDYAKGGFGGAPKFPPSMVLEFLARHHARTGSADALLMAEGTLRAMAGGGLYDQLAGGFARYSVDAEWVVPHFEKMLYDNALLARVALHIGQISGRELGLRVADETAAFLLSDLRTAEGGFSSALDADTEGVEGRFYVWTPGELDAVLGREDGQWAARLLEVTDAGTFENGSSTLQLRAAPDDKARWQRVREVLRQARSSRTPPARDDKVVTAWNGMAVAALAEIGAVRHRPELIEAAVGCSELVWQVHWNGKRLLRVSRHGEAGTAHGVLEDYAWSAEGWLVLYQATGDRRWFERALTVLDAALAAFPDGEGAYFDTAEDAEKLVRRPREWTDNATPCGQSALANAALTAAALGGSSTHRETAERLLASAAHLVGRAPRFAGWWLAAAEAWTDGPREVAIVGEDHRARAALVDAAWSWPAPGRVVAVAASADEGVGLLRDRRGQGPQAWVCRHFRCELPTNDPERVAQLLRGATK
jgi:uncharacterized protein YyaL (SSP411 family)